MNGNNPILPTQYFVPDVEARVFEDGRVYLYGSFDVCNKKQYCSYEYHVFSSLDCKEWVDHGTCFSIDDVPWSEGLLFAPDCECVDGIYYLYFCTADKTIGVATSSSPTGPFTDAKKVEGIQAIDPAIYVENGEAYLYWGQGNDAQGAKLKKNMVEIEADIIVSTLNRRNGYFHEGSSMRKRNDWYYFVFADESRRFTPTALGYAMGKSPLGPFEYKGVIIDNMGCDPMSWNNHGSICQIGDKWFVFYHRSSNQMKYSRRVCVEEIFFDEDGCIKEVGMSSKGFLTFVDGTQEVIASRATYMILDTYMKQEYPTEKPSIVLQNEGGMVFSHIYTKGTRKIQMNLKTSSNHAEMELYVVELNQEFRFMAMDNEMLCELELKEGCYTFEFRIQGLEIGEKLEFYSFQLV